MRHKKPEGADFIFSILVTRVSIHGITSFYIESEKPDIIDKGPPDALCGLSPSHSAIEHGKATVKQMVKKGRLARALGANNSTNFVVKLVVVGLGRELSDHGVVDFDIITYDLKD